MNQPLFRMLWWLSVAPFGKPVVPLVYWMLIASSQPRSAIRGPELVVTGAVAGGQQLVPVARAQPDRALERRQLAADLVDHGDVARALELRGRHQHPAAALLQHVGHLVRAVRGVDVDEDRTDLGRGVLDQHPLGVVRAPDADALPLGQPAGQQAPCHPVDLVVEGAVGEPHTLERHHQRVTLTPARHRPLEVLPDRLPDERHARRAVAVRPCHPHTPSARPREGPPAR